MLEGLYLALDVPPWNEAAKLYDELWFLRVDVELAARRLIARHVATGVRPDLESAEKHARGSDLRNARYIVDNLLEVDEVIVSLEDGRLAWPEEGRREASDTT